MPVLYRYLLIFAAFASACDAAADLTGNWVVAQDRHDGAFRRTYFNVKQEPTRISGSIRVTQFFYKIAESTGGPEGFTLTGSMLDGDRERRVRYEGKLAGDELHIGTRNRPEAPLTEMVAHRAPDAECAMPARVQPPNLHKVADNGLVRTPPMGSNSWNKFAGRVTAEDDRRIG